MGDAEVKDQAPDPGLISQIVPNLYIASSLAYVCSHSVLCAHDVSSGAEQRPEHIHHPVVHLEHALEVFGVFVKAPAVTVFWRGPGGSARTDWWQLAA
jgi:hypothetical protein